MNADESSREYLKRREVEMRNKAASAENAEIGTVYIDFADGYAKSAAELDTQQARPRGKLGINFKGV